MTTEPIAQKTQFITGTRELHQTYLHIGDAKISSLCSKCAALGNILIQEIGRNPGLDGKQVTALIQQIDEIGITINKNLLEEVPKVHNLMHQEFDKQKELGDSQNLHAAGSQYEKSLNRLAENTRKTDQQINNTIAQFYKRVSKATGSDFRKLTEALGIYENTLFGIRIVQIECADLLDSLVHSKSMLKTMYSDNENARPNDETLNELASTYDTLLLRCRTLLDTFNMQEINGMSMMKLADSAQQKHMALMKQLKKGDLNHPDVLLAVAQRHEAESIVRYGLQELEPIKQDFESVLDKLSIEHKKIEQKTREALTRELLASEPSEEARAETLPKKSLKRENALPGKSPESVNTKKHAESEGTTAAKRQSTAELQNELTKAADWLRHDVEALKISTSSDKKELGKIISEQLGAVYNAIELHNWPLNHTESDKFKKNIEKQLHSLEDLIADSLAHKSPLSSAPNSPLSSPNARSVEQKVTTEPDQKSPPAAEVKRRQPVPSFISATTQGSTTSETVSTLTQVSSVESTQSIDSFDDQIQLAIQALNYVRTRIFDAYSRQESFKHNMLENNQPHDVAWMNISQTDMVLNDLSETVLSRPHSLFIKPYVEYTLPMTEMILAIRAEKLNPHFDPINCQGYLEEAVEWLGTLTPQLDYLEHLMVFTEAMINKPQRQA